MFENIRADLRRAQRVNAEGLLRQLMCPGTQAVLVYRFGHWATKLRVPVLRHLLLAIYLPLQWWVRWVSGVNIATTAEIGPGLVVHNWWGIFVGPCRIGRDAVLATGVVINWECREIGDNVSFGPGAKVVHPVRIGNRVRIAANSVVWRDVPDDSTVMGIPGRVMELRSPGATGDAQDNSDAESLDSERRGTALSTES